MDLIKENIAFVGESFGPLFLSDPTDETIKPAFAAIKDLNAAEAAKEWPFVDYELALAALKTMQQEETFAKKANDDLVWEYRRLFVGPAAKLAPPWGSVYMDKEGVVFGESTLALRQWMRENGIERIGGNETPEDHIGIMLLLMAWVALYKPQLLDDYLSQHLLTWSSHFLTQLEGAAKHPFYKGMAQLTKASLEGIQQALKLEVKEPKFYR